MTKRAPGEIDAIRDLVKEFYESIEKAGVNRQTATDALEFATWGILIDGINNRENLDRYLDVMRERCLALWERKRAN
jgi:hypothetical protein